VDIPILRGIVANMNSDNRYVKQCEKLGLSPIQALSALEQLEAVAHPSDRREIVEAINYYSRFSPKLV